MTEETEIVLEESKPEVVTTGEPSKGVEDPTEILRKQLEAARQETEAQKIGRANAERERTEQARRAAEAEASANVERQNAVLGSLEAAGAERDNAKAALEAAYSAGDFKKAAEEQERLSRAVYRISALEAKKASAESSKTTEGRVVAPEPHRQQQPGDPREAYLSQFTPRTQSYLRQRPDVVTNNRLNAKAKWAHEEAVEKGLRPDSDEYFEFLDDELGFGAPAPQRNGDVKPKPAVVAAAPAPGQRRATATAAPPSRATITPQGPGKVTVALTDGQKRAARISGISDKEYAEQYLIADKTGAFLNRGS